MSLAQDNDQKTFADVVDVAVDVAVVVVAAAIVRLRVFGRWRSRVCNPQDFAVVGVGVE